MDAFRNIKDNDVENFLRNKAVNFEERHWCNTYLIVDMEKIINRALKVEGFFTLSHSVFEISPTVSKSRKKKLFNGMPREDNHLHVILIGQLGKYIDDTYSSEISMEDLLFEAFTIINNVNEKIFCRCVLVECKEADESDSDEEKQHRAKLHKKYTDYGFCRIQKNEQQIEYIMTTE